MTDSFEPKAPFAFSLANENPTTFKNEDFSAKLTLKGSTVPAEVFLITETGRKIKMEKIAANEFSYDFCRFLLGHA